MVKFGKLLFVIGVIFAIFGGLWGAGNEGPIYGNFMLLTNRAVIIVLLILGILIGFLHITARKTTQILVAVVGIYLVTTGAIFVYSIGAVSVGLAKDIFGIFNAFALLMLPVAIIIGIKAFITAGRPE